MSTSGGAQSAGATEYLARLRVPVGQGLYGAPFNALQVVAQTSRVPVFIANPTANPSFVWGNFFDTAGAGDTLPANVLPIGAGLEIGGVIYQLKFGGRFVGNIDPGAFLESDPLGVVLPAGVYYIRTFTNSVTWYPNRRFNYLGSGGATATVDLTAPGSAAIGELSNSSYGNAPIAAFGISTANNQKSAILLGDSLLQGQADGGGATVLNGYNAQTPKLGQGNFIQRALGPAGIGSVNVGFAGELGSQYLLPAQNYQRNTFVTTAGTTICEYGRNDLTAGQSLAAIQATLLAIWSYSKTLSKRVFQTTITPATSSTDFFVTTANQTPLSAPVEAVRVALNTWLRDGAPTVAGAAVAAGTQGSTVARCNVYGATGQVVSGASGPAAPLFGIIDVALVAEPTLNAGVWNAAAAVRSGADGAWVSGAFNFTTVTGAFTAADRGRTVIVQGAGAAGAAFLSTVSAINSGTSVGCIQSAATTVAAANWAIYDAWTQDGTHPQGSLGSPSLAACVPVSALAA